MITNRLMAANPASFRRVAVKAMIGVAKASPVRMLAGIASSADSEWPTPKRNITIQNVVATMDIRRMLQTTSPRIRSGIVTGVASAASYVLSHMILARIGEVASIA